MMKPTRIDARGMSRDGTAVLTYLKETEFQLEATAPAVDYYTAERVPSSVVRQTSRWLGKGATMLGLNGQVEADAMDSLAHGFDPRSGVALSQTAGRAATWTPKRDASGQPVLDKRGLPKGTWRGGHRVGFDCCFSIAPKSVSLAFAAADDQERIRILDAMRDAVAQTVAFMETMVEAGRAHGGVEKIAIDGLVASGFTHFSSRELEPQLHEHVLVYACAPGVDGAWGGFEALPFFEHQQMFGALARSAFAQNLAALGYGVVKQAQLDDHGRPTGEVYFELAGVSEATCEAFSTRRRQILEHVRRYGYSKQHAALATRQPKEEPSFPEVDALWQNALAAERRRDPTMFQSIADLKAQPSALTAASDHDVLEQLQSKDAVWTREQLIGQLAREYVGQKNVQEIVVEADAFLQRMAPAIVRINPEQPTDVHHAGQRTGRRFTAPRYCARAWIDGLEQRMIESAKRRQHEPRQAIQLTALAQAISEFQAARGFAISDEQRRAVEHVTSAAGVVLVTGRAGTGKTTVASIFTRALELEQREVIGVSLAWEAANKLGQETGMKRVYSAAKLLSMLDRQELQLTDQAIVFDEAGMADSLTIRRLQEHIDRSAVNGGRGAKLVLQGDSYQLAPVAAGQGFRLLRDAIGDAELTEIRRQRNQEDVATAELFYAHAHRAHHSVSRDEQRSLGAELLARLEDRGQVERTDTRAEAIAALVDDYVSSPMPQAEKLAMASTHADVRELNTAIRDRMVASGEVDAIQHAVALTKGRKRLERTLAIGDRIRFGKLDQDIQVTNGTIGTIERIKPTAKGSVVLTVVLDQHGRRVKLDTATYGELDYGYARVVDKAQGATVTEAFFLASAARMDVHLGLVAATRMRERFRLYATESDMEALQERLGMQRLRVNAIEEGRYVEAPTPYITLAP